MPTAETELRVESGEGPTFYAQVLPLITRKNVRGELVAPEEAIDRVTLLKMSTVWPSYYVLKEEEIGTLEPGNALDLRILWFLTRITSRCPWTRYRQSSL